MRNRSQRMSRWRVLALALGGLFAVALILAGAAGLYLNAVRASFDENVNRADGLLPAPSAAAPHAGPGTDAQNWIVMGTDTRDASRERGRSDALMLVHIPADRSDVYVISYPRDMWVPIPGHGSAKINAAYSYGGMALTVRTMEDLNQVPVDHVAMSDFEGFKDMTVALGGVEVDNKVASRYSGCDFPAGRITVQGDCALVFVRERYDLPRGDFDRAERQRSVVAGIMGKAVSGEVLADPARFTSFVGAFSRYLTVDAGLSDREMLSTAMSLRGITPDRIHALQAPVAGTGTSRDGQSIDIVDAARMAELAEALASDRMDEYVAAHPSSR